MDLISSDDEPSNNSVDKGPSSNNNNTTTTLLLDALTEVPDNTNPHDLTTRRFDESGKKPSEKTTLRRNTITIPYSRIQEEPETDDWKQQSQQQSQQIGGEGTVERRKTWAPQEGMFGVPTWKPPEDSYFIREASVADQDQDQDGGKVVEVEEGILGMSHWEPPGESYFSSTELDTTDDEDGDEEDQKGSKSSFSSSLEKRSKEMEDTTRKWQPPEELNFSLDAEEPIPNDKDATNPQEEEVVEEVGTKWQPPEDLNLSMETPKWRPPQELDFNMTSPRAGGGGSGGGDDFLNVGDKHEDSDILSHGEINNNDNNKCPDKDCSPVHLGEKEGETVGGQSIPSKIGSPPKNSDSKAILPWQKLMGSTDWYEESSTSSDDSDSSMTRNQQDSEEINSMQQQQQQVGVADRRLSDHSSECIGSIEQDVSVSDGHVKQNTAAWQQLMGGGFEESISSSSDASASEGSSDKDGALHFNDVEDKDPIRRASSEHDEGFVRNEVKTADRGSSTLEKILAGGYEDDSSSSSGSSSSPCHMDASPNNVNIKTQKEISKTASTTPGPDVSKQTAEVDILVDNHPGHVETGGQTIKHDAAWKQLLAGGYEESDDDSEIAGDSSATSAPDEANVDHSSKVDLDSDRLVENHFEQEGSRRQTSKHDAAWKELLTGGYEESDDDSISVTGEETGAKEEVFEETKNVGMTGETMTTVQPSMDKVLNVSLTPVIANKGKVKLPASFRQDDGSSLPPGKEDTEAGSSCSSSGGDRGDEDDDGGSTSRRYFIPGIVWVPPERAGVTAWRPPQKSYFFK